MQGPFGLLSTKLPSPPPGPGGREVRLQRPFWYEIDALGVATGGGQGNGNVIIEANRPFLWVASKWMVFNTAGGSQTNSSQPIPDVGVEFYIANTPLMTGPVSLTAIAGAPFDDPQPLPMPFWIPGTTNVKASFVNNETGGDTYNIRLVLIGFQAEA
ncbi:MAG: hypothetical protein ACYCVW_16675 [Rhodocyclaceae bacterium]